MAAVAAPGSVGGEERLRGDAADCSHGSPC